MTLYDELELKHDCSFEDIKHQYRTLARQHHPDLGGDEEKFKKIKFAYEVLSDPVRRKQYDDTKTTNQPNDINTEAINTLATIFFSIIPNFNCAEGNLIEAITNEINAMKLRAMADLSMCDNYISNLNIVKSKLKLKNPNKEDIIMSFVDKQLEARQKDKEMFTHRIKLGDAMLPILNDYEYGFMAIINSMTPEV